MEKIIAKIKKDPYFLELFEKHMADIDQDVIKEILINCLNDERYDLAEICITKLTGGANFGNGHMTGPCKKGNCTINPLMHYCYFGNLAAVKFLVEHGADIEYLSINNSTPIMYAFERGYIEIVKYLLSKGAKIESIQEKMTSFGHQEYSKNYCELINYYDAWVRKLMGKVIELSNKPTEQPIFVNEQTTPNS